MIPVWLQDHTYSKCYMECTNWDSSVQYLVDQASDSDSDVSQLSEQECEKTQQIIVEHVEEDLKPDALHACELCKKTFKFATNLRAHMVMHSEERPFVCEICNKTFSRIATLNRHMQVHSEFKPFKCEFCDRSFRQDVTLKNHIRTHTGERFNCDWCEKSFSRPATLKHHLRIHVEAVTRNRESLYNCALCNKTFELPANLKQHMRVHTS